MEEPKPLELAITEHASIEAMHQLLSLKKAIEDLESFFDPVVAASYKDFKASQTPEKKLHPGVYWNQIATFLKGRRMVTVDEERMMIGKVKEHACALAARWGGSIKPKKLSLFSIGDIVTIDGGSDTAFAHLDGKQGEIYDVFVDGKRFGVKILPDNQKWDLPATVLKNNEQ